MNASIELEIYFAICLNTVMAIQDVWFSNLKSLINKEGGGRRGIRSVADLSGLSEEYVYQLAEKKPNKNGRPREIGKDAAGKIAKAFANGRPDDWFDKLPEFIAPLPHTAQDRAGSYHLSSLKKTLADLSAYLQQLDANDRAEALRMIGRLANEPEAHTKIALAIEGMASAAFAQTRKKSA